MMNTSKVTRLEIIDHSDCQYCLGKGVVNTPTDTAASQSISFRKECDNCGGTGVPGRKVIMWNSDMRLDLDLQDGGRTLKIFIDEKVG